MNKCTDVTLVEKLFSGDLLKVTIDGVTEALWIFDYSEALKFVNEDVIVEYRQDIYKGEMRQFIATFVKPCLVNTLEKEDNIKLYCEQVDNFSNLSFNEIEIGETRPGCIVYCISCEFKSSSAAVWQELVIRDRSMHVAKLRLFDYDNKAANFAGQYVITELSRNKFGFQSDMISPVQGECPPNPEIDIAEQYIKNFFLTDANAMEYINKYNLLSIMKEHIDYEKGYGLMRLAMELAMIDALKNISNDVDLTSIADAILASHGYEVRDSVLSHVVNNVLVAANVHWANKQLVLCLLDVESGEDIPERVVMKQIQDTVDALLRVRKGLKE
jgi:hypothetical protein